MPLFGIPLVFFFPRFPRKSKKKIRHLFREILKKIRRIFRFFSGMQVLRRNAFVAPCCAKTIIFPNFAPDLRHFLISVVSVIHEVPDLQNLHFFTDFLQIFTSSTITLSKKCFSLFGKLLRGRKRLKYDALLYTMQSFSIASGNDYFPIKSSLFKSAIH
jgi:hypothetical protein